jgi:hypothetical protein
MTSHPAGMATIFLRQRGDVQQYNIYTSTAVKGQSLNTSLSLALSKREVQYRGRWASACSVMEMQETLALFDHPHHSVVTVITSQGDLDFGGQGYGKTATLSRY